MRLPGNGTLPGLDDHIVTPETREEMVRGRRVITQPANPPHADSHINLGAAIKASTASGYVASADLLTRVGPGSDFATDVSIRREGIDPATGDRYLEELAFEIVAEQSLRDITERAEDLSNRGLRRLLAIFVKQGEVCEWEPNEKRWIVLPPDAVIEDPTLVRPLEIRALLDSQLGDDAMLKALEAKGNPELARIKARTLAQAVLRLLRKRGLEPTREQHDAIQACGDEDRLQRWLEATLDVESVAELLAVE